MRKLLPSKSKKGVTLVEAVIAVVVLGLFAAGILNLLTAGSSKIIRTFGESADYAGATQRLDLTIAAISNGSTKYIVKSERTDADGTTIPTCMLDVEALKTELGINDATIVAKTSIYDQNALEDATTVHDLASIRGWYITLTYNGATVTGFASNSEGVFDN